MKKCVTFLTLLLAAALPAFSSATTVIHSFLASEGFGPYGPPSLYQGNFYGTLSYGVNGYGSVYRLYPKKDGTYAFVNLHEFNGTDGSFPIGSIAIDGAGNLFGVTEEGGTYSQGTVWELVRPTNLADPWAFIAIWNFDGYTGSSPRAGVVANHGAVFGTTNTSLYNLTADTSGTYTFNLIATTNISTPSVPSFDLSGDVYVVGGPSSSQIVRYSQNADGTWLATTITGISSANFGPYASIGGVIMDSTGTFFGMSQQGGLYAGGTIYKVYQDGSGTWTTKTLYSFASGNLGVPNSPLIQVKKKYYGVTSGGTSYYGDVFQAYPAGQQYWTTNELLDSSNYTTFGYIFSSLTTDSVGNLYGASYEGGVGYGTVWKIAP